MKKLLSVVMITKNADEILAESLQSASSLADEIVVIDDFSQDKTVHIAKQFSVRIVVRHEYDLGKQKAYGLKVAEGNWILILDSDEVISSELKKEILALKKRQFKNNSINGYFIPFQNHYLGRPLHYGGEDYNKLNLFKKNTAVIHPAYVHEAVVLKSGKAKKLKKKMLHYSYRTLGQMYAKFTDYSIREAQQKISNGEKTSLKKIFLYPIHMFWARFFTSAGYKDGIRRIPLDVGFAYMEFLTYFSMLIIKKRS